MRWYWVIPNDRAVADPLVIDHDDLRRIDSEALTSGVPLEHWDTGAVLRVVQKGNDGAPDDALQNHLDLLVFSGRLTAALEQAQIRGFQFLPVRVISPFGRSMRGFVVANIVERRSAMDASRSDYDVYPDDYFLPERRGRIRGVRRATLRRATLTDTDVFRLEEFLARVYVSQRFVEVFDGGSHTGLSFIEASLVE